MILVDTNILVYAYDSKSPFNKKAKQFLEEESKIKGQLCFAQQILLEFFAVVTKKVKHPLSTVVALQLVKQLASNKNILVISPSSKTFLRALQLASANKIRGQDIFDAYLVATMLDNNVDTLATHNLVDFKKFTQIKVFSPL